MDFKQSPPQPTGGTYNGTRPNSRHQPQLQVTLLSWLDVTPITRVIISRLFWLDILDWLIDWLIVTQIDVQIIRLIFTINEIHRHGRQRGSGKNSPVPAVQPGQSAKAAKISFCSGYNFNASFQRKNSENCCYKKVFATNNSKCVCGWGYAPGSRWKSFPRHLVGWEEKLPSQSHAPLLSFRLLGASIQFLGASTTLAARYS